MRNPSPRLPLERPIRGRGFIALLALSALAGCSSAGSTPAAAEDVETTTGGTVAVRPSADELQRGCEADDWEACNALGLRHAEGDGVERGDALAFPLFTRACEGGSHEGCANAAYFHLEGRGTPRDSDAALALYERACAADNARACSDLGFLLVQMTDLSRVERGIDLLRAACEHLRPRACTNLGLFYLGDRAPEGTGPEDAAALFRRACTDGDGLGCRNLGILQANGTGVPENMSDAAISLDRACELGDLDACVGLGVMLLEGELIESDPARGRTLLERACAGGMADACARLETGS